MNDPLSYTGYMAHMARWKSTEVDVETLGNAPLPFHKAETLMCDSVDGLFLVVSLGGSSCQVQVMMLRLLWISGCFS